MPPNVQILDISPGSDGDGRKWPKHHYERNDDYFLERVATDKWIHDKGGPEPGITYRLNKLPHGYAGFHRTRPDGKHVDRYIYGHPNGQFRSLNEFYPHFKHLMDFGGPVGCTCIKCKDPNGKKRAVDSKVVESGNDSEASGYQPQRSRYFPELSRQQSEIGVPKEQLISPHKSRDGTGAYRSESEPVRPYERKLVDAEGTTEIYETMIDQLKDADRELGIDIPIEEHMSPGWRMGSAMSKALLQEWQKLPRYVPRVGEVVLFVRNLPDAEGLAWDKASQTFCRIQQTSGTWLAQPKWEAGIVTQIPKEPILDQDLITNEGKQQAVNDSGFRIEPLSEPGNSRKPYSKQHKYAALHAIRPFYLWRECVNNVSEQEWHPTIRHALTVASSFCVIGRFRFKGIWPNATVFARGVYLGSELITVGDTVRLLPRKIEQRGDNITDIMVVTAIRLRFVNLDMEDHDESPAPAGLSYQTCLHLSGEIFTLDPTRSFDGVGKAPIDPESDFLPASLSGYGQWYHYMDPKKPSGRIELPYTRILGRCFEDTAFKAWFETQVDAPSASSLQANNAKLVIVRQDDNTELSRGLQGSIEARNYSVQHDERIEAQEGKSWFWADTRIEQLDLDVVNYKPVGIANEERTKGQMASWRTALRALDKKKGGLADYHAAKREREHGETPLRHSGYGMVAASAQVGTESPTEGEGGSEANVEVEEMDEEGESSQVDDAMEVDDNDSKSEESSEHEGETELPLKGTPSRMQVITLSDSEDEEDMATNQLAGELAKNIRPNDPRLNRQ